MQRHYCKVTQRQSKILSNMQTLTIVVLATLAVFASAKPSGHWDDGSWDDGSWDDGHWGGHWGGHSNVVAGNGALLVGAHSGHAAVVGPHHGLGLVGHGLGLGGLGHGVVIGHGLGLVGHGHGHGVVVKGPPTVPATIVGPSGKVHADGLWGPTHVHGHGHHW